MTLPASSSNVPVENVGEARPLIRLPLWKISALLLLAPKLVLGVAALAAVPLFPTFWKSVVAWEFWAATSLYLGVVAGLAFLWRFPPRPAASWKGLVMLSRGIRLATTVGLALVFSWIFHFRASVHYKTSGPFFWISIAIATVLIMLTDVKVVRTALTGTIALVPDGET